MDENLILSHNAQYVIPSVSRVSEHELCTTTRLRHFRSLHFAKMLLHIATVAVLVNIAIIELDSFYSLPPKKNSDIDFLSDEVTSRIDVTITKYDIL